MECQSDPGIIAAGVPQSNQPQTLGWLRSPLLTLRCTSDDAGWEIAAREREAFNGEDGIKFSDSCLMPQ
jgi:hypothetical protein